MLWQQQYRVDRGVRDAYNRPGGWTGGGYGGVRDFGHSVVERREETRERVLELVLSQQGI